MLEGAEAVIDYTAPGLLDFLRGDLLGELQDLFCSGLDTLLGLLLDPLAGIDIMSRIESLFRGLTAGVTAAYGALGSTTSAALGFLIRPLVRVIDAWGGDIISVVQSLSDGVGVVFTALWDNIAKPVLDFLGAAGGAVWDAFTGMVTWVWDLAKPIRDTAEFAWDWLMERFDLAWESTGSVRAWLAEKATAAWEAFLEIIEPIKEPLMAVGGILLLLSPLGPILIVTQVLPPVWEKLKWLAENWRDTEVVVRAREVLQNDILPFVIGVVDALKALIGGAAGWLAGMVASVARGMQRIVGLFSAHQCLRSVERVLDHIADQFDRLEAWAEGGFAGLADALGAAFGALRTIFQPILDFLVRLAIVALNPPMLPVAIAGAIWLLLPDEFKPPVINFVLDLLIAFLPAFAAFLAGLGPMIMVLKSAAIGFLRRLRSGETDDATRIAASNKIARLCAGAGPQFVAGYALGLLRGLIDGIIDPFKLLFMLMELVVTALKVLKRVLAPYVREFAPAPVSSGFAAVDTALAIPATAPSAAQEAPPTPVRAAGASARGPLEIGPEATVAAPGPAEAEPAAAPVAIPEPASGGETVTAPGTEGAAGAVPKGSAEETAPAAGEAGAEISFDVAGAASDAEIAAQLSSGAVASVTAQPAPENVGADMLETDMRAAVRESGGTVAGLADLLGGAWDWLMRKAAELGGWTAGKFLELLGLSDYALGSRIGWLSGMILLEVLIAYFTAGGYTVLKQGASIGRRLLAYLLRFLDIGGEILGVLGRALQPLKGPILRGFGAAKGFLKRFDFLSGLLSRIEGIAHSLFRFGDEASAAGSRLPGGRAPHAPRAPGLPEVPAPRLPEAPAPRAPEAAPLGRTAAGSTEAGEAAAREALRTPPARQGRDAVEELGDGSLRAVDEPGVPRVRDDAMKAAQLAEAMVAARTIAETNDALNSPVPAVLAQLMVLKRRYRWIDTFQAEPSRPRHYKLVMIASTEEIDRDYTPTDETSFADVINPKEFENDPAIIDRLSRAEAGDVGGYHALTGSGEFGHVGDNLDSDEVLQNAWVRYNRDVRRSDPILRENPAIALPPETHRKIQNLRRPDLENASARDVLEHHLRQMYDLMDDDNVLEHSRLVILRRMAEDFIRRNGF
ncbi:MAG: hypothetical protein AB7H90_12160 [Alphaproteobacteria bacterium]